MQESIQAALSYARSRAAQLHIEPKTFDKIDVHVHAPEGSIPKDGPSAGITVATALISAFTQRAVRHEVAMTGEITLRGRVLPIGGLKEKAMAAQRAGIKTLLVPKKNERDLIEIPKKIQDDLKIVLVEHMDEVLKEALLPEKKPGTKSERRGAKRTSQK
jgi:ATP-dependent Lon protease